MDSFIAPAGKYWLCDPCYACPDARWDELLKSSDYFGRAGHLDGIAVYAFSTAYGDGEYKGSNGELYPVDAGLIGLTPLALCPEKPFGATLVQFDKPTACEKKGGVLHFGDIVIDTEGSESEDEDECEC